MKSLLEQSTVGIIGKGIREGTHVCSAHIDMNDIDALTDSFPELLEYTLRDVLEMGNSGTYCVCKRKGETMLYELTREEYDEMMEVANLPDRPKKQTRKRRTKRPRR